MWQPDPLTEALESVVGGRDPLDGRLEAAQADTEVFVFSLRIGICFITAVPHRTAL